MWPVKQGGNMKAIIRHLVLLATLSIAYTPTVGATLLFENYTPEIPAVSSGPGTYTVGIEFTVGPQPVTITKLGVFAGTGVMQDTPVGIWQVADTTPALLGSATVPQYPVESGPSPVVRLQDWYFVPVTPFILAANGVYRIGTQNLGSDLGWGGSIQAGNGIASISPGSVWSPMPDWSAPDPWYGMNFMYPTDYYPDDPFIAAANAEFMTAPVPEPAEWTMLLAGLLVVGFIARRRKQHLG
jgi:hypothetical protein